MRLSLLDRSQPARVWLRRQPELSQQAAASDDQDGVAVVADAVGIVVG